MVRDWNRKYGSALIKAYRKHPVLYNKKHPNNSSYGCREKALMVIVDELQDIRPGTLLPEVKRRIKNLRTQYLREKKCIQEAAEQGICRKTKLWCYKDLEFIDDETVLVETLDMPHNQNSTFYPSIDDDSLRELPQTAETENIVPNKTDVDETAISSPSASLIDFMQARLRRANNINSSDMVNYETRIEETSVNNDVHAHENKISIDKNKPKNAISAAKTKIAKIFKEKSFKNSSIQMAPPKVDLCFSSNIKQLQTKLDRLDTVTSETFQLFKDSAQCSHNRAFVENLVYDLDELSDEMQQRVKWEISNEIYAVFRSLKNQDRPQ